MSDKMEPGVTADVIQYRGIETNRWSGGRVTHTVYPIKYMVATGDLVSGFYFYGPFETVDKADQWATRNLEVGTFCRWVFVM